MNDVNERLKKNICQILDQSIDTMDTQTATEIGRLKYTALNASINKKPLFSFYKGAAVTALLVVLSVFLFNGFDQPSQQLFSPDTIELQVLLTDDTFEFFTEEIEFYEWLSEMLEKEPDLLDRSSDLSIDAAPGLASCSGNIGDRTTEFRTDRISGGI
jgi:hypothetical protein